MESLAALPPPLLIFLIGFLGLMVLGVAGALIAWKRWLAAVFGGIIVCGGAYIGHGQWEELQRYEAGPETLSLSEAIGRSATGEVYARIEHTRLNCDAALVDRLKPGQVQVPVLDAGGRFVAVADYHRRIDCSEESRQPLVGVFMPMYPQFLVSLTRAGMSVSSEAPRQVCTYCGPDNARLGVILSGGLALVGILLPLAVLIPALSNLEISRALSVGEIRGVGLFVVAVGAALGYFLREERAFGFVPFLLVAGIICLLGGALIVAPKHPIVQAYLASMFGPSATDGESRPGSAR